MSTVATSLRASGLKQKESPLSHFRKTPGSRICFSPTRPSMWRPCEAASPPAWLQLGASGSWGCIDVSLSVLGAFLDAIDSALTNGVAGMLGGGGHHAYPDHGGALSPVNDMAIGVHHLRRRGIRRVLILDLDAHFGNGTAASFPNDPDLFLFDFHGHASDFWHPDTPHLFKNFRGEPGGLYLQALQKELPNVVGKFRPEACLYAAGMDVFSGTPNPPLRLRVPDIEKREAYVFEALSSRQVPVAYVHAGGYASLETLAALHLITARAAHGALSK